MAIASPIVSTCSDKTMRMRRWRRLAFAGLAALVLAYGASRSLRAPQTGDGLVGVPDISESAQAHTGARTTTVVAAPPPVHAAPESDGPGAMATPSPEWLLMLETLPNLPPTDLGEPLDADPDEALGWFRSEVDPVDIGPALDADDPPADAPNSPTESLLHIGELLDADDPQGYDPDRASALPLHIGELLDADALTGARRQTANR
jgi:hypothetical protein